MANTISASIPIQTGKYRHSIYYVAATVASVLLIWLALGIGFGEWSSPNHLNDTIWQLRYPRVVTHCWLVWRCQLVVQHYRLYLKIL